ncbi:MULTISPECIES: MurR/RpiR family transcriptional regulator [Halomonadaceae]|jgi:DNA-binding MurR/RpiR family transcriptional regulator|uniref:MurR/RpiR family transcriptional regulator n=1 Tax=Billgrantia aerodenitrificans TaxID=2733483 RepID=A0ABS9AYR6_9GAMM|nr:MULTISPECIES: MurR/RpiR family transcriptional regulator [Halomonas]MCE8026545.1 MurR/RpiR family transcriptional regulator [Halomonas aerodenitrificans]MCE8038581.1 MurR/RpiR family transcriptional regulator [Halomonas sp. MCCC 1A11062]
MAADTPSLTDNERAPSDLESLRALSLAIARGESDRHLGPKAQEVLSRLIELRGDPALLSISALAEKLEVNPSTISRLARSLGYTRFGELQRILLSDSLTPPHSFYRQHASVALAADKSDLLNQARQLAGEQCRNIERLLDNLRSDELEAFANAVMNAARVRLYGVRQFHAFASFLAYGLGMLRSDVSLLSDSGHGIAEGLAGMGTDDVLIAASCKPYTREVVNVCKAARNHGIRVLVVTDMSNSPLVRHSEQALLVPHETSFISNSMVAFLSAVECLVNTCATLSGETAAEALSRRDRFIDELKIEMR